MQTRRPVTQPVSPSYCGSVSASVPLSVAVSSPVALSRRALPLGLSLQFEMCSSSRTFKSAQFPDAQHYHHPFTVPGSTERISLLETIPEGLPPRPPCACPELRLL